MQRNDICSQYFRARGLTYNVFTYYSMLSNASSSSGLRINILSSRLYVHPVLSFIGDKHTKLFLSGLAWGGGGVGSIYVCLHNSNNNHNHENSSNNNHDSMHIYVCVCVSMYAHIGLLVQEHKQKARYEHKTHRNTIQTHTETHSNSKYRLCTYNAWICIYIYVIRIMLEAHAQETWQEYSR